MAFTILQTPLVVEVILPFLLVFTVVFAILQKSEVLGKGKKQIDAIVALVIGLIAVAFGNAVGVIVQLTAFLAVSLVVILVFMILWGSVYKQGSFDVPKKVQWTFGVIIAIAVVIAVLVITDAWDSIIERFVLGNPTLVANVIFIAIIIGAIAVVLAGAGGKKEEKKE